MKSSDTVNSQTLLPKLQRPEATGCQFPFIMFPSRRALSAASKQLACRSFRPIRPSTRLYSTETATSTTEEAPAAPPAKAHFAPANTSKYAKLTPKATRPAIAASTPAATYNDIVYQAKSIAYEDARAEGDLSEVAAVDWTRSFYGISARPVAEKQFKVLMQPVEEKDIEVKPDGVIYLPEIKYRRRLNEAFGPMGWGLIPKGEAVVGDSIVTREYALIVDGR